MANRYTTQHGFTLMELSIVLVIIGLIAGGVLVGQDLIRAAYMRATITQIEKYNQAVNTFRGKYSYLPGDIKDPEASSFGFLARGTDAGEGDGNGIIEGTYGGAGNNYGFGELVGETSAFWVDLSTAHLIAGGFNTATPTYQYFPTITATSSPSFDALYPPAKLGQGNYFYVYSNNDFNYFGISAPSHVDFGFRFYSSPALTVQQAYNIDRKIDDGYPQSGNVTAMYVNYNNTDAACYVWAGSGGLYGPPYTTATAGAPTTCFDNGNSAGATQQYSMTQNKGAGVNCALSFKLQ